MDRQFKQGYRMHRILGNHNRLDVDRSDDADRERVETAKDLLKEASVQDTRRGQRGVPAFNSTPTIRWN